MTSEEIQRKMRRLNEAFVKTRLATNVLVGEINKLDAELDDFRNNVVQTLVKQEQANAAKSNQNTKETVIKSK